MLVLALMANERIHQSGAPRFLRVGVPGHHADVLGGNCFSRAELGALATLVRLAMNACEIELVLALEPALRPAIGRRSLVWKQSLELGLPRALLIICPA